jgi:hypothetical protein
MSRPGRFSLLLVLIVCAMTGSVAPAAANGQGSSIIVISGHGPSSFGLVQIPVRLKGGLTVRFHGDPGTGCAARGLCGYAGAVSWRPPSTGTLVIIESRAGGRVSYQASLSFPGSSSFGESAGAITSAQVSSAGAGAAPPTLCADSAPTEQGISLPIRSDRIEFTLSQSSPSVIQTRCAGPLIGDLGRARQFAAVSIHRALRGRLTINLARSSSFAAHGFAGAVTSTLSIDLGRPQSQPSGNGQAPTHVSRFRTLEIDYRAAVAGTVAEHVVGDADPAFCAGLGSCGLVGDVTLAPRVAHATGSLEVTGPEQTPARELFAAVGLRAGPSPRALAATGALSWKGGGTVSADLRQGSMRCLDQTNLGAGSLLLERAGANLNVQYTLGTDFGPMSLRTRCPGPDAPSSAIASALVPLRTLTRRQATITLMRGARFSDDGYTGFTTPKLTVTLTRVRVRTITTSEESS